MNPKPHVQDFDRTKLAMYRNLRCYSAKELSLLAGLNEKAITKYENGITNPGTRSLNSICKVLGIPCSLLYSGAPEPSLELMSRESIADIHGAKHVIVDTDNEFHSHSIDEVRSLLSSIEDEIVEYDIRIITKTGRIIKFNSQ